MQNLQRLAYVVVYALKRYIHFLRDLLIGFIFVAVQYKKDGAGTFGHLAESLLDELFYFGRKQFAGFWASSVAIRVPTPTPGIASRFPKTLRGYADAADDSGILFLIMVRI